MKKKKSNKMKMTIAAGLLITPAIVAQAGVVQASGTVDTILELYKDLNEATSVTVLNQKNELFEKMSTSEKTLIDDAGYTDLIRAKLAYLNAFQSNKTEGAAIVTAINKLTSSNNNLVADVATAQGLLNTLEGKVGTMSDDLEAHASHAKATELLATLKYYGSTTEDTIELFVPIEKIEHLEAYKEKATEVTDFITLELTPILTATAGEQTKKADYENAVIQARAAYTNEITQLPMLKDQPFEGTTIIKFIEAAEANLAQAAKVEKLIDEIVSKPPTVTNFSSKISEINTAYNKLSALQKALVENYSVMTEYSKALNVTNQIKGLASLKKDTEEIRTQLTTVDSAYVNLSSDMKLLIPNADELSKLASIIDKAINVENLITAISITNVDTAYPTAQAAYDKLTSTERGYVLKELSELLGTWKSSNKKAADVEATISKIATDGLKTLDDATIADSSKIKTVNAFVTTGRKAEADYKNIKSTDGTESQVEQLVTNRARLEGLIPIITITDKIMKLKVSDSSYADALQEAAEAFASWSTTGVIESDKANIDKLHVYLTGHLKALQDENAAAKALEQTIVALNAATPASLTAITQARESYTALSANGKKLVKNIKVLQDLERQYKDALKVVTQINTLDVEAKDFAKKTVAAQTAYDKLTLALKEAVDNKTKLDELLPIAQLMIEIDVIRPSAKDFKIKLEEATTKYNALAPEGNPVKPEDAQVDYLAGAMYRLVTEFGPKLQEHQGTINQAKLIEDKIEALKNKSGETFMNDLKIVSDEYKALNSTIKRNVSNAKTLTDLERDYKATLKVIDLIEKLPSNTEKNYATKVTAAQKAYERLTEKQRNDVFNYSTKLAPVLKAANLISRIDKLRIGSKTYQQEVTAIRAEYAALSPAEQAIVYNITKLIDAETSMSKAEEVIQLIDGAVPTAEDYIKKLVAARDAYDALPKNEQKLVTNYKDLQTRERAVKPVLKLDNDIVALDPANAKTFISKYKSAQKAYEKLTMADRGLLINLDLLTGEKTTLYNVINAISSIKNSSKTFVADTKNARSLYDALSSDLKAKVSNYAILQGHELNVEGGKTVDAMIQALNSSEPKEFIANVKAARVAYKALSSANKKAVTLEAELKAQEKYIKPVETAIKAIDDLSNPSKDLSRQFTTVNKALQKLDDKQMTYVSNIDKYSNLSNVIHTYTMIASLKSSDKYYQGNIEAARTAYDKLSEEEKMKVTNYYKLQEALLDMSEVQKVTSIISSLNPSTSSYFADVEKAQAAYKELPSGSRKQVLNYSILKAAEKDMKAAQKVVKQIDDLDPSLRTYESKAKSAKKAYDKLDATQKQLIYNYNKLQAAIFELGL